MLDSVKLLWFFAEMPMSVRQAQIAKLFLFTFFVFAAPDNLGAQEKNLLRVMPLPAHVVQGEGEFVIDGHFGVALKGHTEPRLERAQQRFLDRSEEHTSELQSHVNL